MSHSNDDVIPDSTYPPLEPPGEFRSQIPDHLLMAASDADKYLMSQMSIMRQYSDWSVKALLSQDKNVRLTNGKVRRNAEDIAVLKSDRKSIKVGWKVVTAIVSGVIAVVTLAVSIYQALHGA